MSVLLQRYDEAGKIQSQAHWMPPRRAHRPSIDGEHVAHHGEVTATKGRVRQPTPALPISPTNDYNCLFVSALSRRPRTLALLEHEQFLGELLICSNAGG
jgi:ribosomal protein S30